MQSTVEYSRVPLYSRNICNTRHGFGKKQCSSGMGNDSGKGNESGLIHLYAVVAWMSQAHRVPVG